MRTLVNLRLMQTRVRLALRAVPIGLVLVVNTAPAEEGGSQVQTGTSSTTIGGSVNTTVGTQSPPANDNFANRQIISGTNISITGSLAGATSEAGEPIIPGISSGQTAWWSWTAPSNGIVTLSEVGSGFAPLLAVYTGADLANLSLLATNTYLACYESAGCGCHWRVRDHTSFHVTRGETYQIEMDSALITDVYWELPQIILIPPVVVPPTRMPPTSQQGAWYGQFVQTTNMLPGGNVSLQLAFTPAPPNDNFEQRVQLHGSRTHVRTSNAGATKETGEPSHLGNSGGSSVWYSWAAPASGRVTLSMDEIPVYSPPSGGNYDSYGLEGTLVTVIPDCGNEIDQNPPAQFFPVFAAYTGSNVDSLTPANNLPLQLAAYPNAVSFDAVKGETYQIAFDGNQGTTGDIDLYLALTKPASNDSFQRRIKMHGIYAVATGHNAAATHQAGEPLVSADSLGKTVWWSWRAPVSGTVSLYLGGSDYAFPVVVFTGERLSNLQAVATVASGAWGGTFEAEEGKTYQLALGDRGGLTGKISLTLRAPVIECSLLRTTRLNARRTVLRYTAAPGQVILLVSSDDGENWRNESSAVAHRSNVDFVVSRVPSDNGPFYRAIVVDRAFFIH